MAGVLEIIDSEEKQKRSLQRKLLIFASICSTVLFTFPHINEYKPKWNVLLATRKFGAYLQNMKTNAILSKTPMEARFTLPSSIVIYSTTSCGPNAQRKKIAEASLSEFAQGVEFVSPQWLKQNYEMTDEPVLTRFCYDPLFGSSVHSDGLFHGSVFLAYSSDLAAQQDEHVVKLQIFGINGDMEIE